MPEAVIIGSITAHREAMRKVFMKNRIAMAAVGITFLDMSEAVEKSNSNALKLELAINKAQAQTDIERIRTDDVIRNPFERPKFKRGKGKRQQSWQY